MSIICPTITDTLSDPHEFRAQIERVQDFAERIQIDLMDGEFAPSKSINLAQAWWPDGIMADVHLMYKRPLEHIETLVSLHPHLVIIHAEAEGDLPGMIKHLQQCGIKAGVCLLRETGVEQVGGLIEIADHALLFSGDLGYFGGTAHLEVLDKIYPIKELNPSIEIGWDGGANESNVLQLARGGVNVINVGGAIQQASDPRSSYAKLVEIIANG